MNERMSHIGRVWLIPKNMEKPADRRKKSNNNKKISEINTK